MRGRPWRMQKVNRLLADPLYSRMLLLQPPRLQNAQGTAAARVDRRRRPGHHRCRHLRAGGQAPGKLQPQRHPPRVVSSPAPLVGLLQCGHCGAGMTQASGKSGRYRYYKCTTRLAKNVDACTAKNLPREQTDAHGARCALRARVHAEARFTHAYRTASPPAAGEDRRGCAPHHADQRTRTRHDRSGSSLSSDRGRRAIDRRDAAHAHAEAQGAPQRGTDRHGQAEGPPGARRAARERRHRESLLHRPQGAIHRSARRASAKRTCDCSSTKSNSTETN